ncbi:MAG: hypothetical protein RO009_03220 [Pseudorhodoplanes sp.]|jgi:hypothetical protein|nr:hypothetical protein [Pseudorhodoplanes sp.]
MPPINYTRTVNPLQFEALEPKRFEDLVRQLIYDFRVWRQLEATGRSGSDDGFDARGCEIVGTGSAAEPVEEEGEPSVLEGTDRIWLVQCKREKSIGPSKLIGYLDTIPKSERPNLYGVILAAPADFSKKARDQFRDWCSENGISECYLWGRAELEDALFQPKNDHLLFAYFGLSLSIRKRSDQARLRAQTTIKRKIKRAFSDKIEVLFRDVDDREYPFAHRERDDHRWWVYRNLKLTFRGLECEAKRFFAFIDDDQTHWDYANVLDDASLSSHSDPWRGKDGGSPERQELWEFWSSLPRGNQAWLIVKGVIALDNILEVDEIGDDITGSVHIYVRTDPSQPHPFSNFYPEFATDGWSGARSTEPSPTNRIEKFPAKFRKPMPGQSQT